MYDDMVFSLRSCLHCIIDRMRWKYLERREVNGD